VSELVSAGTGAGARFLNRLMGRPKAPILPSREEVEARVQELRREASLPKSIARRLEKPPVTGPTLRTGEGKAEAPASVTVPPGAVNYAELLVNYQSTYQSLLAKTQKDRLSTGFPLTLSF
jgi:hypothetical protein